MRSRREGRGDDDEVVCCGIGGEGDEGLGGVGVAFEDGDGECWWLGGMQGLLFRCGWVVPDRSRRRSRGWSLEWVRDAGAGGAHEHVHHGRPRSAARGLVVEVYLTRDMLVFDGRALVGDDSSEREGWSLIGG